MKHYSAYPLKAVNTPVFNENESLSVFQLKTSAVKITCFLSGPFCLTTKLNHYWKLSTLGMSNILKMSIFRISMPRMALVIGCMDIIYVHSCCTLEQSRCGHDFITIFFAFIFAVFVWKQHSFFFFFFFFWGGGGRNPQNGRYLVQMRAGKMHDKHFFMVIYLDKYNWDKFSFCKRSV